METDEVDTAESVGKTLSTSHLMVSILDIVLEHHRDKLFMIGTRPCQGDLKGFLELRLVNKQFNQAVCASVRKEFKTLEVDVDEQLIRCNEFIIGRHRPPAHERQRNRNLNADADDSDSDEEMPGPEDLHPDDSLDARFIQLFARWLAETFDPIVESFKISDSWSFKPCSLPPAWLNKLTIFNSMHPDMDYCNCEQCIDTTRNCQGYFSPLSFAMAQDALMNQKLSYKAICCTDSFLADIAIEYTITVGDNKSFDADRFIKEFGDIRCDDITFPVQTIASHRDEHPKPQPFEIIQLILRLWEVKSAEFEVIKFMENDFYLRRCAWEETRVFRNAYFSTYSFNEFDVLNHVVPYREGGTLDRDLQDFLPIFDLRNDPTDMPNQFGSDLSLLSLASQNINHGDLSWLYQGQIAFNMFHANTIMFITSGVIDFRGVVGTAHWLKFSIREIMRNTWGARQRQFPVTGKTAYWINFMDDAGTCFQKVWKEHILIVLEANFPNHVISMDTSEAFENCTNSRIATYNNAKRPDVLRTPFNAYYCSFYDPIRNNTTHIKFVQLEC